MALFIFNFFDKGLHLISVSCFVCILVYYLDNFVVVFTVVQALNNQTKHDRIAYNWMLDLLIIPRNNLKKVEDTLIIVFGIKINIRNFIPKLQNNKLKKAVKVINKVLAKQLVIFFNIQSLMKFLFFSFQTLFLSRVFIEKLWDFINKYPRSAAKFTRKKILASIKKDFE